MKKLIKLVFSEFNESVSVELDDSRSPRTVKAILENLPIETIVNKWGQELYTGRTPIFAQEENAKSEVGLLDVAFWPGLGQLGFPVAKYVKERGFEAYGYDVNPKAMDFAEQTGILIKKVAISVSISYVYRHKPDNMFLPQIDGLFQITDKISR